jgi:hypothetical protein
VLGDDGEVAALTTAVVALPAWIMTRQDFDLRR